MNFVFSRFRRAAVALAFSAVLSVTSTAVAQDGWTFRSPSPTPNRIVSYAHGNGLFVGVGELGEIVTSPDGVTWTARDSGAEEFLQRVIFGVNTFVAISSQSILTSSDGIVWNRSVRAVFDVAFGNSFFVAFAPPALASSDAPCDVLTSTDAVTWTRRASFTYIPKRMEFANGVFVAPNTTGGVLTSADGITWTGVTVASATPATASFAAGNNRFLLNYGNMTYVSSNGLAWREVTEQVPYQTYTVPVPNLGYQSSMGFAGGFFYIQQARHSADSYRQYRSSDGEHWVPIAVGNLDLSTLGSGSGVSVASEVSQFYASRNPNGFAIHSSADGLEWPTRTTIVSGSLTKVVQGLGRFFYGGKFSNDGLTWAPTPIQPTHGAGDRVFTIATKDGVTTVQASSNGLTSTPIDVKLSTPRAVAFGGGIYVMVGSNGELSSSNNGDTWTARNSTTSQTLHAVIYAFNRFLAAGDNGTLITSSNGTTWSAADSAPFANADLKLLAATSNRLLVHAVPKPTGTVATTTTLSGGIQVVISSTRPFASIAALNGVFLGVTLTPPAGGNQYYMPLDIQLWESTDGLAWTEKLLRVPPTYENRAAGSSLTALAVGNGTALLSVAPGYGLPGALTYSALVQRNAASAVVVPEITYPPVALTVHRGETATFALGVNGSGPLTYRWNKDGVAIPGATEPRLTLDLVTTGQAGNYSVTVTNTAGSVTSAAAALTVLPEVPLTITQQPASTEFATYFPAKLTVTVTGSGPIGYQWRRNGEPIRNATGSSYTISSAPPFHLSSEGAYDVIVSAPYSQVTSTAATVTWGGLITTISSKGQVRVPIGATVSITAGATGVHPPFTYQWSDQSGPEIPGATNATLTLTNVQGPRIQSYAAVVRDSADHHEYASFQLIVLPSGAAQLPLVTQPVSQPVVNGGSLTLSVTAPAGANYRYQWRRNFQPIEGATQSQLQLSNVSTATAGEYDVVVYNSDFTAAIVSHPATVTVIGGETLARLVNLSARAVAGTGENTMILGFVVRGSGSGDLLVRSIGPGLSGLGVTGFLSDPHLRVMNSSNAPVAENNDWSTAMSGAGSLATSAEMSQLGAFQLTPGSRDSAVFVRSPSNGLYSSVVSSGDNSTGVLLSEIYAGSSVTQRLVNLSARARVGTGDNLLIGGFVISGNRPMTVLLRGVGPSLAGKGIAGPLTNPKLTLFDSTGTAVGNNDTWGQAVRLDDLRAATLATGAFALNEGSNDAALLTTLSPGVYSVHVTSVDGSAGVALVEIYEVP